MNCTPNPEVTCGLTMNDTCINITGIWPSCFPTTAGPCYRQSDFNGSVGSFICNILTTIGGVGSPVVPLSLPSGVVSIISSINLSTLTACPTGPVPISPIKTTVTAEFQNIYNILCENLSIDLSTPLVLGTAPGLDLKCLQDPCGAPIATLGNLLQALINESCDGSTGEYTATITQSGAGNPVATELVNTIGPASWTRTAAGTYSLTISGTPFQPNKTFVLIGTSHNRNTEVLRAFRISATAIQVTTDSVAGTPADGILGETTIQIKTYS